MERDVWIWRLLYGARGLGRKVEIKRGDFCLENGVDGQSRRNVEEKRKMEDYRSNFECPVISWTDESPIKRG